MSRVRRVGGVRLQLKTAKGLRWTPTVYEVAQAAPAQDGQS